jgi:hypothetical protein
MTTKVHAVATPVPALQPAGVTSTEPTKVKLVALRILQGMYKGFQVGLVGMLIVSASCYFPAAGIYLIAKAFECNYAASTILTAAKIGLAVIFGITLPAGAIAGLVKGVADVKCYQLPSCYGVFDHDWDADMPDSIRIIPNTKPNSILSGPPDVNCWPA